MSRSMMLQSTSAMLQLGDDALILGQRLCEWCGHSPTIEVDLSLSNLALDLIGQATLLLDHATEIEGAGRDADALAYHRDAEAFRNCLLVEQPNGDFASTIVRHFLYSSYAILMFERLASSSDVDLGAIAEKSIKELRYHLDYAADWVTRLGDGTEESRKRILQALSASWRFVDDMFIDDPDWAAIAAAGIVPLRQDLRAEFDRSVSNVLAPLGIEMPAKVWPITGGRSGKHTEHLSVLLTTMQVVARAHPEAVW